MNYLTIQEKEKIGKLLKYYRNKNKIPWKEIEKKISKSTYLKLETGHISKRGVIYKKIFDLYSFQMLYKDNFNEWLEEYLIRFNVILEYYKEEEFDSLINELEKELGPYKNVIIYEQYYQVITYILNYYKYSKYMTLEEIEDCFKLFDCFEFEETIKTFLLEVMFISNLNFHGSYGILNDLYQMIKEINNPIIWHLLGFHYKTMNDLETALNFFKQELNYWEDKDNNFRCTKALMGMFTIYKNTDKSKANEMIHLFSSLKNENKVNQSSIPSLNYNVAMFYYIDCKYKEALPYFMENIKKYKSEDDWIFVGAICTQLNLEIPSFIIELNISNHPNKEYLNYFILKYYKKNIKELINYIFDEIIPNKLIYQPYVQPYWKLFEEELLQFSRKDKRYSSKLVEYIEKKNKTCKKR